MARPTKQWRDDEVELKKLQDLARKSFRAAVRSLKNDAAQVVSEIEIIPDEPKITLRRRRTALIRRVEKSRAAVAHAEAYALPERRGSSLNLIRDVAGGYRKLRDAYSTLDAQVRNRFQGTRLTESRRPLAQVLPEDLLKFLPSKLVVEVDPDGTIKMITSRFDRQIKDWAQKIRRQKNLILKYNDIVKRVKKDLRSTNERVRLSALLTSILMETGIRPGSRTQQTFVRDPDTGKKVAVETFGAVSLGPKHVKFVRENFVELRFQGKQNSTNLATISDSAVLSVLKDYVDKALGSGSKYVFVMADGAQFTEGMLAGYLKRNFGELDPTDFRKLRATEMFLETLRSKEAQMYQEILEDADSQEDLLRDRVVSAISKALVEAQDAAASALSHGSGKNVTVGSYINPVVLLDFFSRGKAADTLRSAVLNKKPVLAFDPKTFLELASARNVASHLILGGEAASLQDLLDKLLTMMTD